MLFTAASFGVILAVSADNQRRKFEEEQQVKAALAPQTEISGETEVPDEKEVSVEKEIQPEDQAF